MLFQENYSLTGELPPVEVSPCEPNDDCDYLLGCAWCHTVYSHDTLTIRSDITYAEVQSHGMCPSCAFRFRASPSYSK